MLRRIWLSICSLIGVVGVAGGALFYAWSSSSRGVDSDYLRGRIHLIDEASPNGAECYAVGGADDIRLGPVMDQQERAYYEANHRWREAPLIHCRRWFARKLALAEAEEAGVRNASLALATLIPLFAFGLYRWMTWLVQAKRSKRPGAALGAQG